MTISPNARTIFRNYVMDGVPSSGNHKIKKADERNWGTAVETVLNAFTTNGGLIFATKTLMDAQAATYTEPRSAWVFADSTPANNGIYVLNPTTDYWTKVGRLPYDFVIGTDTGAGTANAIQITTDIPVADGMIVAFSLFEATTTSPVTVAINGGTALTLKTNRGSNASALSADMEIWGRYRASDGTFRMLNDQDVSALVAQAEAARDEAVAAAGGRFSTVAALTAASISVVVPYVDVAGYAAAGDGGGHRLVRLGAAPSPIKAWHKQSADGAWWEIARGQDIYLEMFGAVKGGDPTDETTAAINAAAFQAALDYLDADPTGVLGTINARFGVIYLRPAKSITRRKAHSIIGQGYGAVPNILVYENDLAADATVFTFVGAGAKHVRTRRNYRGSSGDAQDAAISVGFDDQAIGGKIEGVRFEVYCDYSDDSQGNLGADWDVAFMTSRMNTHLTTTAWRGYPRKCHVLLDATRGVGMPEFDDSFPTDTNAKGIDGIVIKDFKSLGAPGILLLGPKPKPGLLHPGFQYLRGARFYMAANPAAGETVTIGSETFTFRATRNYRYEVAIGATVTDTLSNLRAEWLEGKQAPYETLTLHVNAPYLEIYSTSSAATSLSDTSANISVNELGSSTAVVTQTELISDPAPYYDEILGAAVGDGRDSLGASDFYLDDYTISVGHHSKFRVTDIRSDKKHQLETDDVWCCLHIDGMGGRIFIHKWFVGAGRFESVEPFTVRLGLTGRGFFGLGSTYDSNITAWKSTSGGALAAADQYGKISGHFENTCRVGVYTHDDPGSGYAYWPYRRNGNRLDTNYIKVVNRLIVEEQGFIGETLTIGSGNHGSDVGYVEVIGGETGQSDLRLSAQGNAMFARIRGTPSNGTLTTYTKTGGTGALTARTQQVDDRFHVIGHISITDGVTAPGTTAGVAKLYVDSADGDLKVMFGDGTVKTIVTDT